MRTITAGSNHFIIPKRIVFTGFLIGLGTFLGMYLSEHLHAKRTEMFLKKKNDSVKESNEKLVQEKGAYQTIFDELKDHLADWEKGRDMSLTEQAKHVTSFHDQAQQLMQGLQDMQDLLEEKEFQLWEKEGLLEYQEERLMDSEDLELEMASFINQLAEKLLSLNKTLPEGLDRRPYYGHDFMLGDDEGDMVDDAPRRFLSDEQRRQNGGGGRIAELAAMQRQVERRALQARLPHATSLAHEVRKTLVAALSANGASRAAVKRTARPSALADGATTAARRTAARAVRRARRTMS